MPVAGRLAVNVMSLAVAAAVAGLGIAQVPEGLALPDLRAGRLVQVLDPFLVDRTGLYLVFPSSRQMSAAVRAFIDHVSDWAAHSRCAGYGVGPTGVAKVIRVLAVRQIVHLLWQHSV